MKSWCDAPMKNAREGEVEGRLWLAVSALLGSGFVVQMAPEEVVVIADDRFWVCMTPCCMRHVAQALEEFGRRSAALEKEVRKQIEERLDAQREGRPWEV